MEVSQVRRRVKAAIDAGRSRAQERRLRAAGAELAYDHFLEHVAIPVARQVANALKVEGYAFTVSTPGRGLRLASDTGRDDFIELALDTTGNHPQVLGRISHTRGSRTIQQEQPVGTGTAPDALTEEDVLEFLVRALEPSFER